MEIPARVALIFVKAGVLAVFFVYLAGNFKQHIPRFVERHLWFFSYALAFGLFCFDGIILWPHLRTPLRHLPTIVQDGKEEEQILMESPRGTTPLTWLVKYPDADMLHIRGSFNTSRLFPISPRAHRDILSTNSSDFEKPKGIRAFVARVVGYGLALEEGPQHAQQRKAITPAFNIRKIRELYGIMWDKTGILLDSLQKDIDAHPASVKYGQDQAGKGLVEIGEWASRLTLDVIGPTTTGKDFCSLTTEENHVAKAFFEIVEPSVEKIIFLGLYFCLPPWFIKRIPWRLNDILERNSKYLRGLCTEMVREKKRDLSKQGTTAASWDILSTIIATKEFDEDGLVDQMLTFLLAGHESTASSITWGCWLLATHPNIQLKLREEIRARIPSSASPITWDVLESMPYLNGICEETLRLFPAIPIYVREAVRDTTVAGVRVPQHTLIMLVPYAINRSPYTWGANAGEFVPERWISTSSDGSPYFNKHGGAAGKNAEISFSMGTRACIGRDFARAELRCAIAGMIGKFSMEMEDPGEKLTNTGMVISKPLEGMKLKMMPIEGW